MHSSAILFAVVLTAIAIPALGAQSTVFPLFSKGEKGGTTCAGCTIAVGLIEQLAQLDNQTIDHEVANLCKRFPSKLQKLCTTLIDLFGPSTLVQLR